MRLVQFIGGLKRAILSDLIGSTKNKRANILKHPPDQLHSSLAKPANLETQRVILPSNTYSLKQIPNKIQDAKSERKVTQKAQIRKFSLFRIIFILLFCMTSLARKDSDSYKRTLSGATSGPNCVVSGNGTANIEPFKTYRIAVEARDASNVPIGTGGDVFVIEIYNQCNKDDLSRCTETGAYSVLSSPVVAQMQDNGDGTYHYDFRMENVGIITYFISLTKTGIKATFYPNIDLNSPAELTVYDPRLDYDWDNGSPISVVDMWSARFDFYFVPTTNEDYTFYTVHDDWISYTINNVYPSLDFSVSFRSTSTALPLISGNYYRFKFDYKEAVSSANCTLYFWTPTISQQVVPNSYLRYPAEDVGLSKYDIQVSCPDGYGPNSNTPPDACAEVCGDGKEIGNEKCDDNNTVGGDGCSADCSTVETGWVCSGGSSTTKDTCTQCTSGFYQDNPTNPENCVSICGDGFEVDAEKCDDNNIVSGDGCAADCSGVEAGWVCSGGSPTAKDTCTQCTAGFYQNDASNPETCVAQCGDGLEVGTEKCDDNNTIDGDGCSADCSTVEAGWVCSGGSSTTKDVCTQCAAGFYQDNPTNPENCVSRCGDGLEVGTEKCDDNNTISGDGCAADCSGVETGWVCSGGSSVSKDICTQCAAGFYQDDPTNPENCISRCGDGLEVGTEKCDDNNIMSGDGCAHDCSTVEAGWVCSGGSSTSKDTCIQCSPGFYQDSQLNPENCVSQCGDGLRVGTELCDDFNTDNGDGCSSNCAAIDSGYVCSGGSSTQSDTCTECTSGFYPNDALVPRTCVTQCGDGFRAGSEICDDSNTDDSDGCSSDCATIEPRYICAGGTVLTQDNCSQCGEGTIPNTAQDSCINVCGDGIVTNPEQCDDGNTEDGDGCSQDCISVESGWKCDDSMPSKCVKDYINIPLSSSEKAIQGSTIGITVGAVSLNIIGAILSKSSPNGAFASINQLQLLIMLLFLQTYLPSKIVNYLRSLTMSLINIDWPSFISFRYLIGLFSHPQSRDDLYIGSYESGSTLLNNSTLIAIILLYIPLHLLTLVITKCIQKSSKRTLKMIFNYTWRAFTFEIYVRTIFESFLNLCIPTFHELSQFKVTKSGAQRRSFFAALGFLALILIIVALTTCIWYFISKEKSQNTNTSNKSPKFLENELFSGLKPNWTSRFYPVLFFIRRILFSLLVTCFTFASRGIVCGCYLGVTTVYTVLIIIFRPYSSIKNKDNIQELVNEFFYIAFCGVIYMHRKQADWGSALTNTFYWSLISNNLINVLFSMICFIHTLCRKRSKTSSKVRKNVKKSKYKMDSKLPIQKKQKDEEIRMSNRRERPLSLHPLSSVGNSRITTLTKKTRMVVLRKPSHIGLRDDLFYHDNSF
ncbi:unnamed protein product [Moneuplotes crassus]|uniref:PA14 domain-containing protein n=1 Tax=Euplotes crassus TaxID=5936 RepID=A0AAD1Y569_EUPCR|nr:unnamed protein product [Moneuplotes crassus]